MHPGEPIRRWADQHPWLVALLLSAAFIGIRHGIDPWLRGQAPLIVLLAAPMLAAWLGGVRAGVAATVLCAAAGELLFVEPRPSVLPDSPREWLRLGIFVLYGCMFSWLIDARQRALVAMTAEHDRLLQAREQLAERERRLREMLEASRQAELALRESEQRARDAAQRAESGRALFQDLADNIAQLAWMTDAAGFITWYNRRWYEYTGTTPEQMKDQGWQRVHHPDHMPRVMAKFRRHVASGEPWEDTFPLRSASGEYRWFLSRAFPLRDHAGCVVSWFGTNTDVNAQRQAEEALREADRRKDEFISVLAHELRNPLAPVRNAVEILKRIGGQEPRLARTRDIIDRQVSHMARLIDDLLDVSRIARGKLTLRKEPCDLAAIVRQTADDYRPTLEAAGQRLQLQGCDEPAWVEGDPVRLAQMLGNLLTNAARFHQEAGTVTVETRRDPQRRQVRIVVRDTGIGMDEELLGRLFDPFSQATQDIARSKGGLGLGLTLTKGLAELHGGGVMAESDGPGQGSTFTLLLPLARPAGPVRPVEHGGAQGEPLRILVVEDNHDAAATLGELLQLGGHQVELAHDGREGIARARAMQLDVVISDIGLPGAMSGYDLARALRADPQLEGVYLVALSGYADAQARRRCTEAGFDAHLAKPPDIGMLEQTLSAVRTRRPAGTAVSAGPGQQAGWPA